MVRELQLHSCDKDTALSRSSCADLSPASCADQEAPTAAIAAAATASAATPSSSQQRGNSQKLATATGEDAVLGSDAVSNCPRHHASREPGNSGSSSLQEFNLDGEPLSSDDAPREPVAEVPEHDRHDLLLRVEVRCFTGTAPDILGTVEGVDQHEESAELMYRVRLSDGDMMHYTSDQLNGSMADGFARILEREDTESSSRIKKL